MMPRGYYSPMGVEQGTAPGRAPEMAPISPVAAVDEGAEKPRCEWLRRLTPQEYSGARGGGAREVLPRSDGIRGWRRRDAPNPATGMLGSGTSNARAAGSGEEELDLGQQPKGTTSTGTTPVHPRRGTSLDSSKMTTKRSLAPSIIFSWRSEPRRKIEWRRTERGPAKSSTKVMLLRRVTTKEATSRVKIAPPGAAATEDERRIGGGSSGEP